MHFDRERGGEKAVSDETRWDHRLGAGRQADTAPGSPFPADELSGARARRRLRALDEAGAESELAALRRSLAGDLQAPLRALVGFGHVLACDYGDRLDDEGREYLRRVRETTELVDRRLAALLALAELGLVEMRRTVVDVSARAIEAARRLERAESCPAPEVRVTAGLTAAADERLLDIVLANLIGNAWKFTAGQPGAQITVGRERTAGEACFFVRDNGIGFDMSYADRLFEPFQRLHRSGPYPGEGVGLATVRQIVARHGGRVWAQSAHGRGAAFYFTLPEALSVAGVAG